MKKTILILVFLFSFVLSFAQDALYPMREVHLPDNVDSANCVIYPDGKIWDVKIGWSSDPIVSNLVIPVVGDLNGDGTPEIVCCIKNGDQHISPFRYNHELIVFDGFKKMSGL